MNYSEDKTVSQFRTNRVFLRLKAPKNWASLLKQWWTKCHFTFGQKLVYDERAHLWLAQKLLDTLDIVLLAETLLEIGATRAIRVKQRGHELPQVFDKRVRVGRNGSSCLRARHTSRSRGPGAAVAAWQEESRSRSKGIELCSHSSLPRRLHLQGSLWSHEGQGRAQEWMARPTSVHSAGQSDTRRASVEHGAVMVAQRQSQFNTRTAALQIVAWCLLDWHCCCCLLFVVG